MSTAEQVSADFEAFMWRETKLRVAGIFAIAGAYLLVALLT